MPKAPNKKHKPWNPERKQHQRKVDNSKFYNSWTWRKFRKARLEEEPLCRECVKQDIVTEAQMVDHIIPIEKGGDKLTKENTQPLCNKCHAIKSGKEAHE